MHIVLKGESEWEYEKMSQPLLDAEWININAIQGSVEKKGRFFSLKAL